MIKLHNSTRGNTCVESTSNKYLLYIKNRKTKTGYTCRVIVQRFSKLVQSSNTLAEVRKLFTGHRWDRGNIGWKLY